jgi:fumarylacetoacetase
VRRPRGQLLPTRRRARRCWPLRRLDYELELGLVVGPGNALGEPVPLARAEGHLFGICLLNDWSARDIQGWEMAPLGPFLAKNFATTVSPWIVTLEALAPYRVRVRTRRHRAAAAALPDRRPPTAPRAASTSSSRWAGIGQPAAQAAAPAELPRTSFRHQYWTVAQMLAHHTVGGCNLQAGDLLGSGTISGPTRSEAGALMELTRRHGSRCSCPATRRGARLSGRRRHRHPARLVRKARRGAHRLWRMPGHGAAGALTCLGDPNRSLMKRR